jgi:hypothetical protein
MLDTASSCSPHARIYFPAARCIHAWSWYNFAFWPEGKGIHSKKGGIMNKQLYSETFTWKTGCTMALLTCVFAMALAGPAEAARGAAKYTDKGELMMLKNYRQWVFVGAPVTPNEMNNGKAAFPEFHHVYIDPASFAAYKKTGTFPNGTVIVKELAGVGAKNSASGSGYFAGEFIGVAAAVKDAKRFAKEPGYWAYFSFMGDGGKPLASAKAQATTACNTCHQQNAAEDWVFTQHYPVLRAVKPVK